MLIFTKREAAVRRSHDYLTFTRKAVARWSCKFARLTQEQTVCVEKNAKIGPYADECSVARSLIYVLTLRLQSYNVHASNKNGLYLFLILLEIHISVIPTL